MKKMLYLMSIDWGWIIQRPQLLAIELSKYYDVTIVCTRPIIKRWKSQTEFREPDGLRIVHYFPLEKGNILFNWLKHFEMKWVLKDIDSFDFVLVGGADWCPYLLSYSGTIIYDCMDDYYSMESNKNKKEKILKNESNLANRADFILASSNKLKDILQKRYLINDVYVVRNGLRNISFKKVKEVEKKEKYTLGYIGTVASWMDFECLKLCTSRVKCVDIHIIGPAPGYITDRNNRIYLDGIREHSELYDTIKDYDCLVMPFIVNDIILAVDPVKLYEYIGFGKCIISVYYDEVDRFSDFVYFYRNHDEFVELVKELCLKGFPPKYDKIQQENFLKKNTWKRRGEQIYQYILKNERA